MTWVSSYAILENTMADTSTCRCRLAGRTHYAQLVRRPVVADAMGLLHKEGLTTQLARHTTNLSGSGQTHISAGGHKRAVPQ